VSSVFFFLFLQHCFIYILVLLLCCVSRSSLYCNIHSDLSTLCLSCYFLSIVVSLYLLCCAYRSTLYCNIPSDLCTLYLSCYFFHIVLSLYLLRFLCCVYRSSLYCTQSTQVLRYITTLPHDKLNTRLTETIHKAFSHRYDGSKFVVLGYNSTYFKQNSKR
jgi:hypothetical protein